MEVLSYQLFFLVVVILSSLAGRGARNFVVIGSIVFTIIMVFTMPLALLQLFTIAIAYSISEGIVNRSEEREKQGESGCGCFIFLIVVGSLLYIAFGGNIN
jgi:dolichol kinase